MPGVKQGGGTHRLSMTQWSVNKLRLLVTAADRKYMFAKLTFTHTHILEKLKSTCDEQKVKRQSQCSQYEQHMNSFN